ncbi:MAG: DUF6701 domain-containing protein [Hylemonella sp.]
MMQWLRLFLAALLAAAAGLAHGASDVYTTPGSGSWTVPAWITPSVPITVEAWGGGGAGGGATSNPGKGGGGAGGQYARRVITGLTGGSTISYTVGAGGATSTGAGGAGGDTVFGAALVVARGGAGGGAGAASGAGGAGTDAGGVGDVVYAGGSGSAGAVSGSSCAAGGAGGGGAGSTGAGGNASGNTAGTGTANNGGNGGAGRTNAGAGNAGSAAGGGGGGACRVGVGNQTGGAGGAGRLVITYPVGPAATTSPATAVTATAATLNGSVTPNDAATTVSFEYGPTTAYGSTIAATPATLAAGATASPVSAGLTGLLPGTTYHYRVVATSSAGTSYGADATFTTLPALTKTASAASAQRGDVVTFTITVTNPSATAPLSTVVTDTLPAGMSYVTHVSTLGTVAVAGSTVTWTLPAVPAAGSATLTLAVALNTAGVQTNTATATGLGSASASVLVLDNAVTHFRMDEPANSWNGTPGEVLDSGTTGLHGRRVTVTSPTTTNVVAPSPTIASQYPAVVGSFCNAGNFDGRAVVQVADSPLFDYTRQLSATAWIYPTAYPGSDLYSILSNDVNYEFHLNRAGRLYWWWNASTLTSANTIPLNRWTHVAITFNSQTGRQRIYINGVQDPNTNNWVGTLQPNNCPVYIGGDISTGSGCSLIPGRNFRGMIDEVKLYNYELSAAEVQADMTLGRSCAGTFDHIRIEHDGSGSICSPETVTVKACLNASCTSLYTGAVTVRLAPSGWVGGDTFTFSGGITTRQLSYGTPGNVTLGVVSASPVPANGGRCFVGGTETCTMNFAAASCAFDAVEPGGAPQSRLYTKLAGVPFAVDVLALSSPTTINTAYTGTVAVDLVDTSSSSCPSGAGLTTPTSVTFTSGNAGRRNVTLSYPHAARNVRVRVQAGSGAPACSTDNFAIRPQQFTVTAPVLNNTGLTGTPRAVAGTPFALEAAAGVASGYQGTVPVLDASRARDHNGAAIASGTLSGTFGSGDGSKASGTSFKYLDVGNLQLLQDAVTDSDYTQVDQAPGDCVAGSTSNTLSSGRYGCLIGSAPTARFGRWYPSHYTFSGSLTAGCSAGGYTYMGQDALGVALTLRAHASSGGAPSASDPVVSRYTAGYTTGYTNLAAVTVAGDNAGTPVAVSRLTSPAFPTMPNTALWSAGLFQINDTYAFSKLASPDGPYDAFKLQVSLSDPDGAPLIGSSETATTRLRHGRLWLGNAYGSELLDLPVALQAQYWTGGGWALNTLDSCTTLPAASITMGNYQGNLSACETRIQPTGTLSFSGGRAAFSLRRPGQGNSGSVDLGVNVGTGISGRTCVGASETDAAAGNVPWFGPNQGARASFGLYRAPLIYMRENY